MNVPMPDNAVTLPPGLLVECPLVNQLRALEACAACPHHRGITKPRFPGNDSLKFAQQHAVACGYPVARRLLELEV